MDEFAAVRWEEHRNFWLQQVEHGLIFRKSMKQGIFKPEDLFCIPFIGALPYYSRIRVLDYHGLVDPVIAHTKDKEMGLLFHTKKATSEYMKKRKVDFIIIGNSIISARKHPGFPEVTLYDESLDLSRWEKRRYVAKIDYLYMVFFSTKTPDELLRRFSTYGIPIYIYVPFKGYVLKPVYLEVWLNNQ